MAGELGDLIRRLEEVTGRLESVAAKGGGVAATSGGDAAGINASLGNVIRRLQTVTGGEKKGGDSAILQDFDAVLSSSLASFLSLSKQIGGDVATQADMVAKAFQVQREFMTQVGACKEPKQDVLISLLKPTSDCIQEIQEFRERNRTSKMFNHLSAIGEGIPLLGWVTIAPKPAPYVMQMQESAQFYTNRVLKEYKATDPRHVEWAKAFMKVFTDIHGYVKQHHTTGLVWNAKGREATASAPASAAPPPPAAGAPPPPPPPGAAPKLDISDGKDGVSSARSALFSDLNKGEGVTTGLKKVTPDMQTHKNPALRQGAKPYQQGPTPYKAPTFSAVSPPAGQKPGPPPVAKKPPKAKLELSGSKWLVEFHEGNKGMVVETTALKQTVYIYKCNNCTIQVKGKVNSIVLDGCKKTGVAFDSLVSSFDVINCQSVQMQVMEFVPTISIDKTDGCQIFLSKDSLETSIVTAKSSAMNVLVPTDSGEFSEHPVPEQFKTTWNKSTGKLATEMSEIA